MDFLIAATSCAAGNEYKIYQRTPPARGCYLSTFDYPGAGPLVIHYFPNVCQVDECLGGLKYSTDINANGPFFYSITSICMKPKTKTTRDDVIFMAESDGKNPTYKPTAAFEEGQIMSQNTLCWSGTHPTPVGSPLAMGTVCTSCCLSCISRVVYCKLAQVIQRDVSC